MEAGREPRNQQRLLIAAQAWLILAGQLTRLNPIQAVIAKNGLGGDATIKRATCLRRFGGVFFLRLGAVFASRNAAAGSLPLHSAARGARRSYVLHHVAARNHSFPEGWGERALRSQTTLAYQENVGSQFLSLQG